MTSIVINILLAIGVLGAIGLVLGAVCALCADAKSSVQSEAFGAGEEKPASEQEEKSCLRAFVKCAGAEAELKYTYVGASDCLAASLLAGGHKACAYSCLGFGSCMNVCKSGAISVESGVAEVSAEKCTGCGECEAACPRGVIEMIPRDADYAVQCNNTELGSQTRKICEVGCIGCLACVNNCKYNAIEVCDSIAHIDYSKCARCGECASVCPRGIITAPPEAEPEEEAFDEAEYFSLQIEEEEEAAAKE